MWIDDNGPALDETGDHPPQPLSRTLNLESDMVLDEADDVEDVNIVWLVTHARCLAFCHTSVVLTGLILTTKTILGQRNQRSWNRKVAEK